MLTIRLSSSYVLIITTPSAGFSERVGARPPATLVNTLFCCEYPGGSVVSASGRFLMLSKDICADDLSDLYNIALPGKLKCHLSQTAEIHLQLAVHIKDSGRFNRVSADL